VQLKSNFQENLGGSTLSGASLYPIDTPTGGHLSVSHSPLEPSHSQAPSPKSVPKLFINSHTLNALKCRQLQ